MARGGRFDRPLIAARKAPPPRRRHQAGPLERRWRDLKRRLLRHPLLARAGLSAAAGLLCGTLYVSGLPGSAIEAGARSLERAGVELGLKVARVTVSGHQRTDESAISLAIGARTGEPLFDIDVEAARARTLLLPWIEDARIMRVFPDRLHIEVSERAAAYLWEHRRKFVVLDGAGAPITEVDPAQFAHLPHIVGEGAPEAAAALYQALEAVPQTRTRLRAASRIGERRWDLHFDNHVVVQLPDSELARALADLERLIGDRGLLERDILIVDMRDPERLRLTLTNEAARFMFIAGKDT